MQSLTTPTQGRVRLWLILAVVWSLFLVQYLSMDHGHKHFSWVGAAVWAVVLAGLLTLAGLTWRGMRRGDRQ